MDDGTGRPGRCNSGSGARDRSPVSLRTPVGVAGRRRAGDRSTHDGNAFRASRARRRARGTGRRRDPRHRRTTGVPHGLPAGAGAGRHRHPVGPDRHPHTGSDVGRHHRRDPAAHPRLHDPDRLADQGPRGRHAHHDDQVVCATARSVGRPADSARARARARTGRSGSCIGRRPSSNDHARTEDCVPVVDGARVARDAVCSAGCRRHRAASGVRRDDTRSRHHRTRPRARSVLSTACRRHPVSCGRGRRRGSRSCIPGVGPANSAADRWPHRRRDSRRHRAGRARRCESRRSGTSGAECAVPGRHRHGPDRTERRR
ncbi:hypothetical protein RhoFasGS6_04740 [Rhodococcus fascians]|nr:hypothetical protein [Rhodococcus fascians]